MLKCIIHTYILHNNIYFVHCILYFARFWHIHTLLWHAHIFLHTYIQYIHTYVAYAYMASYIHIHTFSWYKVSLIKVALYISYGMLSAFHTCNTYILIHGVKMTRQTCYVRQIKATGTLFVSYCTTNAHVFRTQ